MFPTLNLWYIIFWKYYRDNILTLPLGNQKCTVYRNIINYRIGFYLFSSNLNKTIAVAVYSNQYIVIENLNVYYTYRITLII